MARKGYLSLGSHYERCLEKHGDTHLGVDWPSKADAETRYGVMLEVIKPSHSGTVELLDFGCGASHLYEYILRRELHVTTHNHYKIEYSGLDLSAKFVDLSRQKLPLRACANR